MEEVTHVTEQAGGQLFLGLSKDLPCKSASILDDVLDFWGCLNKVPQLVWLRQQEFIISRSWRPEGQYQGVPRLVALWAVRQNLLHAPLLIAGDLLANCLIPWLVDTSLQYLSSLLCDVLPVFTSSSLCAGLSLCPNVPSL